MKPKSNPNPTLIVAVLLGLALQPAYAAEGDSPTTGTSMTSVDFKTLDTNKDGYLSMQEFTAKGSDDLAFRAADINGDGQVDPGEYDKHRQLKAVDPLKSGAGTATPSKAGTAAPKPTRSPYGY
jgi:hypothetical protein